MRVFKRILWGVFLASTALIAAGIYRDAKNAPPAPPKAPEPPPSPETLARHACREFIERALNDPSSAEWPYKDDWQITAAGENTWKVQVTMRAKNGFGALVLSTFICETKRVSGPDGDGWALVSLNEG